MTPLPLPRHRYTRWTPERERELTTLWNTGARVDLIAKTMGISLKAVYKKVWTLRGQGVKQRKAGRPRRDARKEAQL